MFFIENFKVESFTNIAYFVKNNQLFVKILWWPHAHIQHTVKVLLFAGTNFCGFKHQSISNQWENCILDFYFGCFMWTTKSAKIRTPRLIMISQYSQTCCSDHLSYVTGFQCSIWRSHKAGLTVCTNILQSRKKF